MAGIVRSEDPSFGQIKGDLGPPPPPPAVENPTAGSGGDPAFGTQGFGGPGRLDPFPTPGVGLGPEG